jgi:hypothetical protein
MVQLVINLPEGILEELERELENLELDLDEEETFPEEGLIPPPPGSDLLSNLRYLVLSQRVSLQQAQQLVDLYLTATEPEFQVPEELYPLMQQVRLLEMDEVRMREQ